MTATFAKVLIALTALLAAACGVSPDPALDEGADTVVLPPVATPADTAPTATEPTVTTPAETVPAVTVPTAAAIERATVTAPGYTTIAGWAQGSEPSAQIALAVWVDGVLAGTVLTDDPVGSDTTDASFVLDLALIPGGHEVCVTSAPTAAAPAAPLDCKRIDVEPNAEIVDDGTILITAVHPDPTGSVRVRGVITGANHPDWVDVATNVGRVATPDGGTSTAQVAIIDGAFRFELQGLSDGTYQVCTQGLTVDIATRSDDSTAKCATAIVGPLSIGTTGRAIGIDAVAPAATHPLYLMERDGGISVELTDGSTLWFFGDSTNASVSYFVNNTAAWASADAPTTTRDVVATEPVRFAAPPAGTCAGSGSKAALWPESAVALPQEDGTDRVVVVMSKVCLGDNWLHIETVGFAVVEYRYDPTDPPIDEPIRGEVTQPHLADADAGYGRALLLESDGFLYGYQCGTYRKDWETCGVARVRPDQVTDPAAWRYWNGADWTDARNWVADEAAAGAMELPGDEQTARPVAAFGVTHLEGYDSHLLVYSPWPGFCSVLAVRASDTPVGPWTDAVEITFPNCMGTEPVKELYEHCYAGTPQTQLREPDMFAGGYYDMKTDEGAARYYTFAAPFVVVHDR